MHLKTTTALVSDHIIIVMTIVVIYFLQKITGSSTMYHSILSILKKIRYSMESRPLRPTKESKLTVFIFVRSKYLVRKKI